MDIENIKKDLNEIFEKRPTKEIYEKCLMELIIEKNKTINLKDGNLKEENIKLLEEYDKLISNIKTYLSIASK